MSPSDASAALERRLSAAGFQTERRTVADRDALVARRSEFRWKWVATRLHTFVVAFDVLDLDEATAETLTSGARQYAISHKGGVPRGLQTGTATVSVFLTKAPGEAVRSWFTREPNHRFAALAFPVLVDVDDGAVTYYEGRMRFGAVYASHLRTLAQDVVGGAGAADVAA